MRKRVAKIANISGALLQRRFERGFIACGQHVVRVDEMKLVGIQVAHHRAQLIGLRRNVLYGGNEFAGTGASRRNWNRQRKCEEQDRKSRYMPLGHSIRLLAPLYAEGRGGVSRTRP